MPWYPLQSTVNMVLSPGYILESSGVFLKKEALDPPTLHKVIRISGEQVQAPSVFKTLQVILGNS